MLNIAHIEKETLNEDDRTAKVGYRGSARGKCWHLELKFFFRSYLSIAPI
jgi:hypothetical protein